MSASLRFSLNVRRTSLLLAGSALLFATGACEKLVGIEDTPVTASADDAAGTAGKLVDDTNTAGSSQAGSDDDSAGSPSAGKSNGTSGAPSGGKANDGGAGKNSGKAGGGSGGASAGAGGGAAQCDCKPPTPVCENGSCVARGPVQAPAGLSTSMFYIDTTEVTNAQYAKFLTAKGSDTSGQRADCEWNESYQPSKPIGDDKRPAVNVDFCDALAFCDWAGERLCGDLSGTSLAITDLEHATKSEWYLACAGTDDAYYPYGGFDQVADACNEYGSGTMADVGTFDKCEGHYDGVFDLVGNAAEWVDACDDAGADDHSQDNCWLMGGSYLRSDYKCQTHYNGLRSETEAVFGFRCCSK